MGHPLLNGYERSQFLEVSMGQRTEVFAQFLAAPGCSERMLEGLHNLNATLRYVDNRSGYALVLIAKDKLLSTLDLSGIEYAYIRDDDSSYFKASKPIENVAAGEIKAQPVPQIAIPYSRVSKTLPPDGPYFATDEIGLTEFWKQHPEADGRGVRVAVVDAGFDLLHPALQQARSAVGEIVPKIADLATLNSPEEDSSWVRFGDPIQTRNDSFEGAGRTWTVPKDGTYRFGFFRQDLVLGPEGNSHSKEISLSVGVLWDQQSGQVWVDTDGDGSFKNQRAIGDYGMTHDVDWFGVKQGEDDNRIPFGIKMDAARSAVYVRIGGDHGAFVAGPLAANKLTGGLFNGAAPDAELVDENFDRQTYLASNVAMFARSDVDVVNRSGALGRTGYTGNAEGMDDFTRHVVERVIAVYNKPIATYSAAAGTIHVNDYAGPEMLRRNRQLGPPYRDTVSTGSVWWIPDGLVNTVLAPSANLDTQSRYKPLDILWPDGKRHSFFDDTFLPPAPDGYVIGSNNSPAIPVVSGILADLISEAKREHVRYNAMRLNNAIFTGTRLLPSFPLSQQGYGLVNAAQSWDQLAKMAMADDPANQELTSFVVSRMAAGYLAEVHGFSADLAKPGTQLEGEIWITRHGGYAGGRKYTFSLRGNDVSYQLLDHKATLQRDKPVRIRFRTNGVSGWNIVFLELRDAKANVVMQDVPLSVRVPDVPEKIAPGVDKYESTIQPLCSEYLNVRVGEDAQAARYIIRIPYTASLVPFLSTGPSGKQATPPGDAVNAAHHVGPMENAESLVPNDQSGTQTIHWGNHGGPESDSQYDSPAPDVPIHAELTLSKYAVAIEQGSSDTLTVTNKLADIEGKVELYNAMLKTAQLIGTGLHASGELEHTLSANLVQWRVQVRSASTSSEPVDVYLLKCSGKTGCRVAAQQQITAPGKTLTIDEPQAGNWKIVVRSRGQVSHPVTYVVQEALLVQTDPIDPVDSKHTNGATWILPLPTKRSDTQYAAFRIAGTPGNEREKNGLLIAMTPLGRDTP